MKSLPILLSIALIACAAACALAPQPITLAPVGPDPHGRPAKAVETGSLIVYSATKVYPYDRESYIEHTAYGIYSPDGLLLKSVQNAASFHAPEPKVVSLSPGVYDVQAWADGFQLVKVPVVIKPGRTTEVNLQIERQTPGPATNETHLVRMADGRIVGWSADMTGTEGRPQTEDLRH